MNNGELANDTSLHGLDVLTHSRMQCSKSCRKQHYFRYLRGWRPERDKDVARIGTVCHKGIEWLADGLTIDDVAQRIQEVYGDLPRWVTTDDGDTYQKKSGVSAHELLALAEEWPSGRALS